MAYLLSLSSFSFAQDGLILPMPSPKSANQSSTNQDKSNSQNQQSSQSDNSSQNHRQNQNSNNRKNNGNNDSSGAILPMPSINKNNNQQQIASPKNKNTTNNNKSKSSSSSSTGNSPNEPLIALPAPQTKKEVTLPKPTPSVTPKPKPTEPKKTSPAKNNIEEKPVSLEDDNSDFFNDDADFPDWSNEPAGSLDGSGVEDLLPPTTETTVAESSSGEKIVVFPKDTGAAIFMVMKSWQCSDYDSVSLINQALEVYGKDAGEQYQINGLDNIAKGVNVTVEEEDITFDELLDIVAAKTGNDWGCDIANKTIYVYPKGIKTDSYLNWED